MANTDLVDGQVQTKINSVNSLLETALSNSATFMSRLNDLENLRPPFFSPDLPQYTPDTIPVDAERPEAPDVERMISGLESASIDDFSPGAIKEKTTDEIIPQNVLDQMPALPADYQESAYSSGLLDALKETLLSDIENGTTGLSDAVQQAMWDKRTERDDQAWVDAADKIRSQWATTGFDLPDGVLAANLRDLATKRADARLDVSRDITTESFKMAVENRRFVVTQSIVLESALMQHFNNVAERALKAIYLKADMSIKIFAALVDTYKSIVEAKLADVQLQVAVERGRIDVYLALLQKSKTEAEISAIKIDALVRKYGVDVQAFSAEISRAEAFARTVVEQQRMVAQNYLARFQAQVQQAKDNLEAFTQVAGIKTTTAVSGAKIYADYIGMAVNSLSAVLQLSSTAENISTA